MEENVYSRARCIENVLNNHLGYDNKYSTKIRKLSKECENLESACLWHRSAVVEVESKTYYLKFFGRTTKYEFEMSPSTLNDLKNIIKSQLAAACEEGEQLYLKIVE